MSRAYGSEERAFRVPVLYLHPAFQAFHAFQDVQFIGILSGIEPTVCSNPLFRTTRLGRLRGLARGRPRAGPRRVSRASSASRGALPLQPLNQAAADATSLVAGANWTEVSVPSARLSPSVFRRIVVVRPPSISSVVPITSWDVGWTTNVEARVAGLGSHVPALAVGRAQAQPVSLRR